MSSYMITLQNDIRQLQTENSQLKTDVERLNGEVEQRDKLITSLELQIRALLADQPAMMMTMAPSGRHGSTTIGSGNTMDAAVHNHNHNKANGMPPPPPATNVQNESTRRLLAGYSLMPPRRSIVEMSSPLAPEPKRQSLDAEKKEEEEIEKTETTTTTTTEIQQQKEEKEVEKTEEEKPKQQQQQQQDSSSSSEQISPRQKVNTKGKKAAVSIIEEDKEMDGSFHKKKVTMDAKKNNNEEGTSERPVLKAGLKSSRGALKSLPREISIANDDDEEVSKYSHNTNDTSNDTTSTTTNSNSNGESGNSPTFQAEKTNMCDAYNAKGLYTGTVSRKENLPHGTGKMEYHQASKIYEGEWHLGHWHGKGIITTSDGVYTGDVVNDLKDGGGEMVYASDGRKYQGRFEQDEPINGTVTFKDGKTYTGAFKNGVWHGKGLLAYPDGSKYQGDFRNGVQHGKGVYNFSDGSVYEGESVMGSYEGKGKMTWSDGGWYEGEWKQGEANGYGMEIRPDGRLRHHGDWRKGVPIRN